MAGSQAGRACWKILEEASCQEGEREMGRSREGAVCGGVHHNQTPAFVQVIHLLLFFPSHLLISEVDLQFMCVLL